MSEVHTTKSPIHSLPPELLSLILDTTQKELQDSAIGPGALLAIVSLVSRYWHDVGMETPSLYPSIKVSPLQSLTILEARLKRWQDRAVHLKLCLPGLIEREEAVLDEKRTSLFCALVLPHLQNSRRLTVYIDAVYPAPEVAESYFFRHVMSRLYILACPHLQQLDMRLQTLGTPFQSPVLFTGGTPMLRDLRIGGPSLLKSLRPSTLAQVTELQLDSVDRGVSFLEFCTEIASFASLTSLSLYDDHWIDNWSEISTPYAISIPSLRHLHIYGRMLHVSRFLTSVSAPRLEALTIAPVVSDDLGGLAESGLNLFPNLQSLSLCIFSSRGGTDVLGLAMKCFPSITALVMPYLFAVPGSDMASPFASLLDNIDGLAWPRLKTLAFRITSSEQEVAVRQLIQHRIEVRRPIAVLRLDTASLSGLENPDWLKERVEVEELDVWRNAVRDLMYSSYRLGLGYETVAE